MSRLSVADILSNEIIALKQPIISDYGIFQIARLVYSDPTKKSILSIRGPLTVRRGKDLIQQLERNQTIKQDPDFNSSIYRVNAVSDTKAEEIACIADPYSYVSHLSAMQLHRLTEKWTSDLIITTLNFHSWKLQREKILLKDYADSIKEAYPFKRIKFGQVIRDRPIIRHEISILGQWYELENSAVKLATIGQTFFDMLNKPKFCGGMTHVLKMWKEHASKHLEEIITRISLTDKKIVKVRAGYILQEMLKMGDPRIEEWQSAAERGGSRLLDPEKPYTNKFSEKWMISINT